MVNTRNTQQIIPIIEKIKLLKDKKSQLILAIDGRCGCGKSTLADQLGLQLNAEVFHMDDYFLPKERRTPDRLAQVGGNVDYERVEMELLQPLRAGEAVSYRPYDCSTGQYEVAVTRKPTPIVLVEGSYSMHPKLQVYYDLTIFVNCAKNIQLSRLKERESAESYAKFIEKWIPYEEKYFASFDILNKSDFVIDTQPLVENYE
ncbi:uridine kinase family protein [Fundicoccus culcitae]|uniref:Phosphoribulokinase/uridine kinase domain-containing protein n=1 Tax=Fundicoccus culcitae TaxID=2969821 RepID=A0ABY5P7N4_9LACT|nr:hypothetical protein [Fundicoccus culcitae]UUX34733.1 hypothetical protein NRE15_03530 [Fundicoccus culcitae]